MSAGKWQSWASGPGLCTSTWCLKCPHFPPEHVCPQKLDLCSHHVRCASLLGPPAFVELALRPTPSPLLLPDPGEGIGTWHVPPPHTPLLLPRVPAWWGVPQLVLSPGPLLSAAASSSSLTLRHECGAALRAAWAPAGPAGLPRSTVQEHTRAAADGRWPAPGRPRQLLHVSYSREGRLFAGMHGQEEAGGASSVATHSCRTS